MINKSYVAIPCAYIETQDPYVNMEAEIVAVHYGMSADRSP